MKPSNSKAIFELGENRKDYYNAIAPPLIQTSNFAFDSVEQIREAFQNERSHHLYSRGNNPTTTMLCQKLAALQGTEDALVFGSGAAANAVTLTALLKAGDHVICVRNCYTWTYKLLTEILSGYGVETTWVDGRNTEEIIQARKSNTRLLYLESPTSLVFDLQDLNNIVPWAKENDILTMIDHSFAGPMNHIPLQAGVDIIMHTMSKYINGHSDVMGGLICASKEIIDSIFSPAWMTYGAVLSANDAWLTIRGLRTLSVRMDESIRSTESVISYLQNHKHVRRVIHPMCTDHPQHEIAKEQIGRFYPLFAVEFNTDSIAILDRLVDELQIFKIAVSWGGFESLALPIRADYHGSEWPIIRFYIGLEGKENLTEDLDRAIGIAFA